MPLRTEINAFTVVLICSLVPLVSLAPTVTTKGKITTGHFTTSTKILASLLEMQAKALFKDFITCSSLTEQTTCWLMEKTKARNMVQVIPDCPAFEPSCCSLHVFSDALQDLRSHVEGICGSITTATMNATLNQLEMTLKEGTNFYTCQGKDLPRVDVSQIGRVRTSDKKAYIWWLLHKYEQYMGNTTKLYSPSSVSEGKITLR